MDSKGGGPLPAIFEKSPETSRKTIRMPNEKRSGIAPKNRACHAFPRYPNNPFPHRA